MRKMERWVPLTPLEHLCPSRCVDSVYSLNKAFFNAIVTCEVICVLSPPPRPPFCLNVMSMLHSEEL